MSTSVAALAELRHLNPTHCACESPTASSAAADITDLRNRYSGPCVFCDRHVMKNAGWLVRKDRRWAVCCERHAGSLAPRSSVGKARQLQERVERIRRRAVESPPPWLEDQGPGLRVTDHGERTITEEDRPGIDERIAHLTTLGPDWDTYGGKPPTAEALAALEAMQIVPCCDGGIQLEWHRNGQDVEVVIEPDGTFDVWASDRYRADA